MRSTNTSARRTLRLALLAGAAGSLPLALASAQAQEVTIDTERTTPIETSTADNGNPADIVITADGSITLAGGTAVTVNSDNDVTQAGNIIIDHVDDAIGVFLTPGNSGTYTLSGQIQMDRTEEQTELNNDETPSDYADNRIGILLGSGGTFTGDIIIDSTGGIEIFGDASRGIDLAGTLDGGLGIDGSLTVVGVNSSALAVGGTVTGNVVTSAGSDIFAIGAGTTGIDVDGTIEGSLVHGGALTTTGYFDTSVDPDDAEDNNNELQASLQSGAAIDIAGTVEGGFLINGNLPLSEQDEDYVTVVSAAVNLDGGAPAIWIRDGAVLGALDTSNLSDAYGEWGFINRGVVTARGIYEGVDSHGVLIGDADIFGGIRNDGTLRASAYNANATAVTLADGASLGELYNGDTIETALNSDQSSGSLLSIALHIEEGASLPLLTNEASIQAGSTGDNTTSIAILDDSGTLTEIVNTGAILSQLVDFVDEDGNPPTGSAIAIDVSANTSGVTVRNTVSADFDEETDVRTNFGSVLGDVLFGSGADSYLADAGITQGDISFGLGADTASFSDEARMIGDLDFGNGNDMLTISNEARMTGNAMFGNGMDIFTLTGGAFFTGNISDTDGLLDLTVTDGSTLYETGTELTTLRNLMISGDSVLGIGINENGSTTTSFRVTDTASLGDGVTIQPVFLGGAIETVTSEIILANTLNVDPDQIVIGDADGNQPFLFNISFDTVNANGTENLVLNIQRRTAEELGLQEGLAPAYVPTLEALATDTQLGQLVLNFTQEADFRDALSQLLAGPLDAPLAYARAQNNSVTSIITQRLDLARNSGAYPRTFWIQEENYFLNRDSDEVSNGFDGGGFSIAAGVDAGLDSFVDAVGLSASISSAKYDEKKGGDFPFSRLTYGVGGYAAFSLGEMKLDTRAEYAITESESERNILIGDVDRSARGEWEGTQLAASARLRYTTQVIGGYTAEPFVSADFVTIDEDAYEETGGGNGIDLAVSDRTYESMRGNIGVRVGKVFELRPSAYDTGIPGTLHPQFTLAWSQEFIDDPLEAEYQYLSGGDAFTLFADPDDGSAILGADVAYENEYAKIHIGVSGTAGGNVEAVTLRAGVGLKW